jgi:hypothetical protein
MRKVSMALLCRWKFHVYFFIHGIFNVIFLINFMNEWNFYQKAQYNSYQKPCQKNQF